MSIVLIPIDGELLMKLSDGDKVDNSNGKKRATLIHFVCDKNNKVKNVNSLISFNICQGLNFLDEIDSLFLFSWYSKAACGSSAGSLSGWSIFFILFFTGIGIYLLGGILYNRNNGRRGLEQIPNLDFWKRLCTVSFK